MFFAIDENKLMKIKLMTDFDSGDHHSLSSLLLLPDQLSCNDEPLNLGSSFINLKYQHQISADYNAKLRNAPEESSHLASASQQDIRC